MRTVSYRFGFAGSGFGSGLARCRIGCPSYAGLMRLWKSALLAGVGIITVSVAPALAAPDDDTAPVDGIDSYPLAEGNYTVSGPSNYGWVFFRTSDGRSCGIAPNGGPVGCDAVAANAPVGANQIMATGWSAAEYRSSQTPTFTRNAPVLPAGQRVQTMGAGCAVDYQESVHCQTQGNHGFILSADDAVLW